MSATWKYDEPEVENVTRGRSPSVTCSTEGRHNFHIPRTTVCHMFCRALSFDTAQLMTPLCLHCGMPRLHATPIHGSGSGPRVAAYNTAAAFLHFVTFTTKHGSTSDKACSRLLGSRCVQANAHRQPRSRF